MIGASAVVKRFQLRQNLFMFTIANEFERYPEGKYLYESDRSYTTRQLHRPATVRKKAWKIATSGAYFAAGFESAAVCHFTAAADSIS